MKFKLQTSNFKVSEKYVRVVAGATPRFEAIGRNGVLRMRELAFDVSRVYFRLTSNFKVCTLNLEGSRR